MQSATNNSPTITISFDHKDPKGMGGAWRDDHPDNIQATHGCAIQKKDRRGLSGLFGGARVVQCNEYATARLKFSACGNRVGVNSSGSEISVGRLIVSDQLRNQSVSSWVAVIRILHWFFRDLVYTFNSIVVSLDGFNEVTRF